MNSLTNDMKRLCGEIAALRDGRASLMSGLVETREAMQGAVARMLAGFGEARGEMARQTKAELGEFVSHIKEAVTGLRQKVAAAQEELREDLAGSHQAWHGASAPSRKAPVAAESFSQAEETVHEAAPKAKKKKR